MSSQNYLKECYEKGTLRNPLSYSTGHAMYYNPSLFVHLHQPAWSMITWDPVNGDEFSVIKSGTYKIAIKWTLSMPCARPTQAYTFLRVDDVPHAIAQSTLSHCKHEARPELCLTVHLTLTPEQKLRLGFHTMSACIIYGVDLSVYEIGV
jgi:hypothetical protein